MGNGFKQGTSYLLLLVFVLYVTGCTSPKFKLVKEKDYQQPTTINLPAADENVEARLDNIIYFNGPGSWKVNALWDEYVFTILNTSDVQMKIVDLYLVDPLNEAVLPGGDPWLLIDNNRANMRKYRDAGILATYEVNPLVIAGVATAVVALQVAATVGVSAAVGSGGVTGLYAIGATTFIVLPAILIVGVGTMYKNKKAKELIAVEFELRDLDFPIILEPGELVQGSVFYPIVPSPQSFNVEYRLQGDTGWGSLLYLECSLEAFKGLHEELLEKDDADHE